MKKICVSVGEITVKLSTIEDGDQDYGGRVPAGKLQDPKLLTADLDFCGSILFDLQRYLGNGPYLVPSPLLLSLSQLRAQ
jgi:hypothetical protein